MESCEDRTARFSPGKESSESDDSRAAFGPYEWTLKRNCSLSPRQFASLLASLALVSMGVAAAFAYAGAWWVLAFALIEVAALAIAFVVYARHAGDYERIVVTADAFIVELGSGARVLRQQGHPAFAQVRYTCPGHGRSNEPLILLGVAGKAVEVGRFVSRLERESLAREILARLQAAGGARWR